MQILPTPTHQNHSETSVRLPQWQTGQRLQALVLDSGNARDPARIQIGSREVALPTAIPHPPGQRLTVEVFRNGEHQELRIVGSVVDTSRQQPLLARLLPTQGSQVPMLALLSVAQNSSRLFASLPIALQDNITQVLRQLPTLAQVTEPNALREALRHSGLWHESLLASALAAGTRPPANVKSALLGLAVRLRQIAEQRASLTSRDHGPRIAVPRTEVPPPQAREQPVPQPRISLDPRGISAEQLLKALGPQVEQTLSRLALHQLSSAETTDSNQLRWLLELPVRTPTGIDLIHLKIDQERNQSGAERERAWNAELALELPNLGAIFIRLAVRKDQLSVHLWLRDSETQQFFAQALPELREALERRGLHIGALSCQQGEPPEAGTPETRAISGSSLDLHA